MAIDKGRVILVRGHHSMIIELSLGGPTGFQYARQNMEV